MEPLLGELTNLVKIGGILFSLVHFVIGFFMYKDMVRINNVIQTSRRGQIRLISNLYMVLLFIIILLFILV